MSELISNDNKRTVATRGASRRQFLALGGAGSLGAAIAVPSLLDGHKEGAQGSASTTGHGAAHSMGGLGTVGDVAPNEYFDAMKFLSTWNDAPMPLKLPARDGWSDKFYRETKNSDGTRLREYQIIAVDREIEIAPGVYFPAWTYNNQVPGPTIRATEGDRIRIRFVNEGSHPHTIHFHGWHPYEMDGAFPDQFVDVHQEFIYEFDADPVGLHLYHCHSVPLKRHIHKGLYGVFIVDPDPRKPEYQDNAKLQEAARSRNPDYAESRDVREVIMMMNAFDTDFDGENEVYAVNTVAFQYMRHTIPVKVGQLLRVYLVNITEFDPINSFHLHAGFFDVFRTGTKLETVEHTDTVTMCQAERAILEFKLRWPGLYMFHAHQSEFAELGWMGAFEASQSGTIADAGTNGQQPIAAPAFELVDSVGRPVSLADYLGRSNVVLVLSQGGGCTHCMDQARGLDRAVQAYRAKGAEVLLVTPSDGGLESIGIRHAADKAGGVFRKYGLYKTANQPGHGTFLVDKTGIVRWRHVGNEPFMDHARLLAELDRVNTAS
jgi:FtsP/CotA-like multicopper oxidase with cupredoxin domain/peroxiredoxin